MTNLEQEIIERNTLPQIFGDSKTRKLTMSKIPGRIVSPPHGALIQQREKRAILSDQKDEKYTKVPIYIVSGGKIWAKVILAPPVAITASDFRKSRAEHHVSDAELERWGWWGKQLYLSYFQFVESYVPPLGYEEPGGIRWIEEVEIGEEALEEMAQSLEEEARHRRDRCMECDVPPTKQVLWAEGKAIAWFCAKCLKQWHEEGDGWHAIDKLVTIDGEALSTEEFKQRPDELKSDDPLKEAMLEEALPEDMPERAKEIWKTVYRTAYNRYDPEADPNYDSSLSRERNRERYAHSVAWAAVKKQFKKVGEKWQFKETIFEEALPDMPKHAKEIWKAAYKSAYDTYDPKQHRNYDPSLSRERNREAYARSVAWSAVKEKYEKVDNRWQTKEVVTEYREVIKKVGNKWELWSSDGTKRLGTFKTREDALKRERQIQFFKHLRAALVPALREFEPDQFEKLDDETLLKYLFESSDTEKAWELWAQSLSELEEGVDSD